VPALRGPIDLIPHFRLQSTLIMVKDPNKDPAPPAPPEANAGGEAETTISFTEGEQEHAQATARAPWSGAVALTSVARAASREHVTREEGGRYTIKYEFARGGIGRVLVAFDEHIGREVALKELLPEIAGAGLDPDSPSAVLASQSAARFLQEARITGLLEHPGIVPVHEIGRRADNSLYYTMQLVRGTTLKERLCRDCPLSERLRLLANFQDLCQTVAFAHSRGVVHRDLKPANVMVGEFGETVVLDWGLASVKGLEDQRAETIAENLRLIKEAGAQDTVEGQPLGTPSYMSPEQAQGQIRAIDERSDVWSLGAILYELLAGHPPFTGRFAREVMDKVISDPAAPLLEIAPKTPPELAAIAMKCLDKDPARRYKNAGALAEDVGRFLAGGLVSAYEYSMAALAGRWLRKHWPVVATLAAALLVLIAFYTWSYIEIGREKDRAEMNEGVAKQKEALATRNLAESYLIMGRWAESAREYAGAQVYYAKSLALNDTLEARASLNNALTAPRLAPLPTPALEGGANLVYALAFTPDRRALVVGRTGAELTGWDGTDGKKLAPLAGADVKIGLVAMSQNGAVLAAAGRDLAVRLWDPRTGALLHALPAQRTDVRALALSPDGKSLATASMDGVIKIWDSAAGTQRLTLAWDRDEVCALRFGPDGARLIAGENDGRVKLWDAATGTALVSLDAHAAAVCALAVSQDGARLATGDQAGAVKLWDAAAGALIAILPGHHGEVIELAFSDDGDLLASAGADRIIRIWDPADGNLLHVLEGHAGAVYTLAFQPHNPDHVLASVGNDLTLKLWEATAGRLLYSRYGHAGLAAWSPDGDRLMAETSDHGVRLYATATDPVFRDEAGAPFPSENVAVSPDAKFIAAGDEQGTVAIWSMEDRHLLRSFTALSDTVMALAFSPDSSLLAVAGRDPEVKIYQADSGALIHALTGHKDQITALAFSPDGKVLVSGAADQTLCWWDPQSGARIASAPAHQNGVKKILFSPDSELALTIGILEPGLKLWQGRTGTAQADLDTGPDAVVDAALSADGRLAAAGLTSRVIKVFDLDRRALKLTLEGHECAVKTVAIDPAKNDQAMASGSCDTTVKFWDLQDGAQINAQARHQEEVSAVAYSPDGRLLASAGEDRAVKLWNAHTGVLLYTIDGPAPLAAELLFTPDGQGLIARDVEHALRRWPLLPEVLTGPPAGLLDAAERATALKVIGMRLHPWKPDSGQVSATPLPQNF
jgi:eukaryotic-like serine/threonine-protein kinase